MPGSILIVDDVASSRIVLKVKLTSAYYRTIQAGSGAAALQLVETETPDLILIDMRLPDMEGTALCQKLRALEATRNTPMILLTAQADTSAKVRALESGADDFLSKPLDEQTLLARVRSLLRARDAEAELALRETTERALGFAEAPVGFAPPALIALVAARPELAMRWRAAITPHLSHRIVILTRSEALLETPGAAVPDVFLIASDLVQPGDGLRLMSDLRSRAATRHSAVCFVLETAGSGLAVMALDLGANDLVAAPFCAKELALRLSTLIRRKQLGDRLRASLRDGLRLSVSDPLTGLYNRRYALPHLARIAARAQQTGRGFAVMVLDLDRFKRVNDQWGHAAGDAVLVEVAARLRENLRAVDLLARMGGEEFLVAMPDTALPEAQAAAERLRRVVEHGPVPLPDGAAVQITVSIGLAISDGRPGGGCDPNVEALIVRADHALLGSKAEGRNQVTTSEHAA